MTQRYELFRQMQDVLADLYLDRERAEGVAKDAGLDPRWIAFSTRAVDNWRAILEEAERKGQVPALLDVASTQYPAKQQLLDVRTAYWGWVAAGRPLSERERQLQTLANTYHLAPPEDGAVPVTTTLLPRLAMVLNHHILFGGRDRELARLDAFLAERSSGYLLVTGPSGFGKSALLANWIKAVQARHQPVGYHFISRSEGVADEKFATQNLCEQLASYHGLRGILPAQETTLRALYPQLLQLPPATNHTLAVVLDGLDEALNWNPGPDLFPPNLPVGVYVVFSARTEPNVDWLAILGVSDNGAEPLELQTMGLHEIESLLRKADGKAAGLAEDEAFVTAVYDVSHGDPFYLHFLVQDIQAGDITKANIKDQPDELNTYLGRWWEQLAADVNIREVYDLLGLMSVAKGHLLPKDFAGISPKLSKGALLKNELRGKLRRYLSGNQQRGYAIAHLRFGKYLTEVEFESYEVQDYLDQLLDYCTRWSEHHSVYALTYYAQHLADAAEKNGQPARREYTERLVKVTSDQTFQQVHISVVDDLPALQGDLERALKIAAANDDEKALLLVVESALALVDFRNRELQPEPIFTLARQGEVAAARRRLALFDIDTEWRQAILLTVAWLAKEKTEENKDAHAAGELLRKLLEEAQLTRPEGEPLRLLWDWVSASLTGTRTPKPKLDAAPAEEDVRFAVERMQGSGDIELHHSRGFGTLGVSELGYLAKEDGPYLVAFAYADQARGDIYLNQYVAMHTGYGYTYYRNRSLWILLDAVVHHPRAAWVRGTVEKLAMAALASSGTDFRAGLPMTIQALRAQQTGQYDEFEKQRGKVVDDANQLNPGRTSGDITGEYKRRLAALAEVLAQLLNRQADADALLRQAQSLPYGFAGYGMPAYLALAEAVRVCQPENRVAIEQALGAAQEAAHNIQDDTFCARSTARFNAMREFWRTLSGIDDLQAVALRLCENPAAPDFTALHRVGELYEQRSPVVRLSLPPEMWTANTLRALADVYKRPLTEFQRLNRKQGWTVDQELAAGTPVRVPDPEFATLLAARFAAEALVAPALSPQGRRELIQSLVPVAAANPTTLDTVLARLLLAEPPSDQEVLVELERLSSYPMDPSQPLTRPLGIPG